MMDIPEGKRLIIIEGISGSGKTTFFNRLQKDHALDNFCFYSEEELLLGWKHFFIPEITRLRIGLMENILSRIEEEKDTIFVLERFHISTLIFGSIKEGELEKRYVGVLKKIRDLSSMVVIFKVPEDEIPKRIVHRQRDGQLDKHLKRRLIDGGYSSLEGLYSKEQRKVISLAKVQGIDYILR